MTHHEYELAQLKLDEIAADIDDAIFYFIDTLKCNIPGQIEEEYAALMEMSKSYLETKDSMRGYEPT